MGKKVMIERGATSISRGAGHDYTVRFNGGVWKSQGRGSFVTFYKQVNGKFLSIIKRLYSARDIKTEIVEQGDCSAIKTIYSGFSVLGKRDDSIFTTTVTLFDNGKITFAIKGENEEENHLRGVHWPSAFNRVKTDRALNYSVAAYRQGCIINDKKGAKFFDKFTMTTFKRDVNTGDCYMPLWGRVCGNSGYCAFIENANDAAVFNSFGSGLCILAAPYYFSSLGKLAYERVLQVHFYNDCDYNTFAKEYRKFLVERGEFVTIDDKIKTNANVARLIGTPVIHTNIYKLVQPESEQYDPNKPETVYATFAERAEHLKHFKKLNLERAYLHLDGWGKEGYDNLHPYVLPPCPKAGGAEGMKLLADTCKDIGYIFGIHDQYRDYYFRSPEYDKNKAVMKVDGKCKECNTWLGGAHNWLCSSLAPDFVKRTYKELEELGINVEGSYLDVFSIVLGDECFNPDHRITRTESIAYRAKCFDLLRAKGLIVCSEEPGALMINAVDLVHHAPYKANPQDNGRALGIPIPFFNLVYHECVFAPWRVDETGGWGIPKGESGEMHCVLNAATPYFVGLNGDQMESLPGIRSDKEIIARIDKNNRLCAIQKALYDKEMMKHSFLSDDKKVQQCVYSDGTVITVDFAKNTYNVAYPNKDIK